MNQNEIETILIVIKLQTEIEKADAKEAVTILDWELGGNY